MWASNHDAPRAEIWPTLPRVNRAHNELSNVKSSSKKAEMFSSGRPLEDISGARARALQRFEIVTDINESSANLGTTDAKAQVNFVTGLLLKQFHMSEIGFVVPLITIVLETQGDVPLTLSLVWDLLENPSM